MKKSKEIIRPNSKKSKKIIKITFLFRGVAGDAGGGYAAGKVHHPTHGLYNLLGRGRFGGIGIADDS